MVSSSAVDVAAAVATAMWLRLLSFATLLYFVVIFIFG